MKRKRKNYSPEEKVTILKRHLVDKIAVSNLCDEYQLQPTVFYRRQKEFFENGASAFERDTLRQKSKDTDRIPCTTEIPSEKIPSSENIAAGAPKQVPHPQAHEQQGQKTNLCELNDEFYM